MPHRQIPLRTRANPFPGLRLAESPNWSRLCINTSPQLSLSWRPYCWDSTDYVCMNRTSGKLLLLLFRWLLQLLSWLVGWLVGFYGMSNPLGYFMPNTFLFTNSHYLRTLVLVYLTHRWDPNRCYHSGSVDLGVMATKGYSTFPRAPEPELRQSLR